MVNVQTFSIWLEVENETNHQGKLHWLTKALSEIRNESVHASCQLECQALHWPVDISWMSRLRFFYAWVEASSCRKWLLMFFCKDHFRGRMVHVWCVPWSLGEWSNLTMFQPGWFLLNIKKGFQHIFQHSVKSDYMFSMMFGKMFVRVDFFLPWHPCMVLFA